MIEHIDASKYTAAQIELLDFMSEISEECHCAEWVIDNGPSLWGATLGKECATFGPYFWGGAENPECIKYMSESTAELIRLRDAAGGWWHWQNMLSDGVGDPVFLPIPEWEGAYRKWLGAKK